MLFNTWEFCLFFVVVYGLYLSLATRGQNVLLLLSSYLFYGWWDPRFVLLLIVSTVVDYSVGRAMEASSDPTRRRHLLWVSLATNLGILGFFKYCNFFIDSAAVALNSIGLEAHLPVLSIVLPVGISFYTFQTMAYTIDVYRKRLPAVQDPVAFGVYVSYFPQLVAGPIERAQNLMPQFASKRTVTPEMFREGALLVLIGLVRKVAIADVVAREVDIAFGNPEAASSMALVRAVVLFSLQIYGDFAGYSDMARGISRMMGIELMENFNHPYFTTNITVFWRKWHISLSTWLRDYLYIPLGGSRTGKEWKTYRNLMLTMLLGGLWHGAAWTFVVWGAIHGVALAVHKLILGGRKLTDRPDLSSAAGVAKALGGWAVTMLIVMVAWVFFRAPDFSTAYEVLSGIVSLRGGVSLSLLVLPVGMTALMLCVDIPQYVYRDHTAVTRWSWPVRGVVYTLMVLLILMLRSNQDVPFIYFQF